MLWPVPLELVGAMPGSRSRIAASLTTARGTWRSSATYTVPVSGVLDLAATRPQLAPFTQPDSAGLFWSLDGPDLAGTALVTQWMHETHEEQPVARFWSATSIELPVTSAVLMFDDPSPGASAAFTAPLLARFGASVLVLPVTAAPDGVRAASVVDRSTVDDALTWLGRQEGIDSSQVFAYGTGVSEPLAVWAATRFPTRVHGFFAAAGAPQLLCLPSGDTAPAFEDGAGSPCRVSPGPTSAAFVLPLGGVAGPVVLACGGRDKVLPSACAGQKALAGSRGVRAGDSIQSADAAGHAVSVPPGALDRAPDASRGGVAVPWRRPASDGARTGGVLERGGTDRAARSAHMIRRAAPRPLRRRRLLRAGAVLAVVAAALVGCAAVHVGGPRFVVRENPTGVWEQVRIALTGLPPGQRVTVAASTRTSGGWSSRAVFAVPPSGEVDLARRAPVQAAYSGADPMGLFWTMHSETGSAATSSQTWGGSTLSIDLVASVDGVRVAATRIQRTGLSVAAPAVAVAEADVSGDYFAPVFRSEGLRPAVLVLDGTDPGSPTGVIAAATLSAMGYPALDVATYGTGRSEPRRTVPAERLLAAVTWLMAQPGVDDQRVFVMGTSRGAALALWLAVAHPGLVYGAIAPGGTTGLVCPSPVPSPAITVGGAWVPCVTGTTDVEQASVLDLSRVYGPLVLGCAERDEQLATGCAWMAEAARQRPARPGDTFVTAVGASHLFYTPPYSPLNLPDDATAQATEQGREAVWRAIASALAEPSTVAGG